MLLKYFVQNFFLISLNFYDFISCFKKRFSDLRCIQSIMLFFVIFFLHQSQSVLKLQVEEIEQTQERVLTCFLFPQERKKAASLGNYPNELLYSWL